MNTKVQYDTLEAREELLNKYKHLHLIEEHNITEGNFLVFSDTPSSPLIIYVSVSQEEFEELKQGNTELMLAIAEMAEVNALEKAELQLAIAELAEVISNG